MKNQEPKKNPSIGIVIPTYQAAKHLPHCLKLLVQSPLKPRLLVIDSSSTDNTVQIAQDFGAETIVIPQSEFNHGLTREKGRRHIKTDIVIMMTQDAYPTSAALVEHLVEPLVQGQASIAYARQLPHLGAGFFESFPRSFNYPANSHIRSLADISTYGVYTFFCSNSCAAYLNTALDEVGGFPSVLFGEDTLVVAKLLHRQHKIAYTAKAEVRHSHDYSLRQEFSRHFDIGMARHMFQDLLSIAGKDSKRGQQYFKTLVKQLYSQHPTLIPYACLQTAAKLFGYQLGKACVNAPVCIKRALSSQKSYW